MIKVFYIERQARTIRLRRRNQEMDTPHRTGSVWLLTDRERQEKPTSLLIPMTTVLQLA